MRVAALAPKLATQSIGATGAVRGVPRQRGAAVRRSTLLLSSAPGSKEVGDACVGALRGLTFELSGPQRYGAPERTMRLEA